MALTYHDQPSDYHQARVHELDPGRWRLAVLNVDGDLADPRYTAVWVERPGPAWRAVHDVAEADYQAVVDRMDADGFTPVLVTASGAPGRVVFAAVFAADQPRTYARHGLQSGDAADAGTLQNAMASTAAWGFVPQSVAVYGDWFHPTFAAVWTLDPTRSWAWWWGSLADYQGVFTALNHSGMLPRQVAVTGFDRLAVFTDDRLGRWWAAHDDAEGDFAAAVREADAQGFRPIAAQAGFRRYAATFALDDVPWAKSWHVDGPAVPGAAGLDDAIRTLMIQGRIRSASIAVARDGTPLLQRAYTWAEAGYPTTTVRTRFRVASVSKLFTAAAVQRLADDGTLALTAPVFAYLGVDPALPHDPRMDSITIGQCATSLSGLPHDFEDGVTFRDISVGLGHPADVFDLARHSYQGPLAFTPGQKPPGPGDTGYSNAAFHVLGAVVQRATGRSVVDVVNERLARPAGIQDIAAGRTAVDQRLPGEVGVYEDTRVGVSQLELAAKVPEAFQYGGDILLDSAPGSGGLVMSPISIARFLCGHAVYGIGGRTGGTRYGTFAGTSAGATSDGAFDLAFATNREIADDLKDQWRDTVQAYLDRNGSALTPFDADEGFPIRGVLLAGRFRTQDQLNTLGYDDMRNVLIVELTSRTATRDFQAYDNAALAGAGAALVFFRHTGLRDDAALRMMTADGMRNTLIAELAAQTGAGAALQAFSTLELALIALGSDLAVRGRVPGSVSSWIRGVLLLGGFRSQHELNPLGHDDMRNILIVELTARTAQRDYQAFDDADLEAAGALLVLLRWWGYDDATLRAGTVDDLRNTVISRLDAQTRLGPVLQRLPNLDLVRTALGCRPLVLD